MTTTDLLLCLVLAASATYWLARLVIGRKRFRALKPQLEGDGILLEEGPVFTRFNFPMIKRITFSRVFLTKKRFVMVHWITRNKVLQAPLGHPRSAGGDDAWFEVEQKGKRKVLLLRTTLRGGGRIRLHLKKPDEWMTLIRKY